MAFNINAHVILQGPKNISAITKNIRTQLQGINVNVGVNIPKNVQNQINLLNKQLNSLNTTNKKLTSGANSASSSVQRVGTSAKQASNAMQVLGKETALTFKRFAAAGLVTATFFKMTQAISTAIPKALEFERGLNKLQQITGSTKRGLDGLAKSVDGLARGLGKDANEILEVAQIFAQTGQSIKQVQASIRAVARSSLAPSFGEMKQTAEGLVAALNQFGIAASDSEKVLGSLNRVSKKFAVESDDLIAAIRRAGGVFALSAGQFKEPIDALNEFSAIFTAVRSTTR
jgi:predicted  nucleic acid-binding Zn-ribbon protein